MKNEEQVKLLEKAIIGATFKLWLIAGIVPFTIMIYLFFKII